MKRLLIALLLVVAMAGIASAASFSGGKPNPIAGYSSEEINTKCVQHTNERMDVWKINTLDEKTFRYMWNQIFNGCVEHAKGRSSL